MAIWDSTLAVGFMPLTRLETEHAAVLSFS